MPPTRFYLRHHEREQRVGGNVEGHAEAHVAGALVHEAGQLAIGHIELSRAGHGGREAARWAQAEKCRGRHQAGQLTIGHIKLGRAGQDTEGERRRGGHKKRRGSQQATALHLTPTPCAKAIPADKMDPRANCFEASPLPLKS